MRDQEQSWEERERRWRRWMTGAQGGDGVAYEKLLLELLPYVRHQVARRVGEPSEREDVVQNVFVSLHRARHTYRGDRAFAPWLRAVVRNAAIDWMRSRGRRVRHELARDIEEVAELASSAPLPEDDALSPELEGALASLPAAQRQAVELLHVQGLSVAEAASRVGVSPGALKVRAHRGYRTLRARLGRRSP